MKKYLLIFCALALFVTTGCEDEPSVTRSKNLLLYGPPFEMYAGDSYIFEAVQYQLNDNRTWSWSAEKGGTEIQTGEGEFFEVYFETPGIYTIYLREGNREGSVEVEVLSNT